MKKVRCFKLGRLTLGLLLLATDAVSEEIQNTERSELAQLVFDRLRHAIRVEIADTAEERARGLMYRKDLAADSGMLFVFPEEKIHGVWMKNTLIPLDILFMSAEGRVVSSLKNVLPCKVDACDIYRSEGPSRYMLEVNAGFIDHWAIQQGDKISVFVQR